MEVFFTNNDVLTMLKNTNEVAKKYLRFVTIDDNKMPTFIFYDNSIKATGGADFSLYVSDKQSMNNMMWDWLAQMFAPETALQIELIDIGTGPLEILWCCSEVDYDTESDKDGEQTC